MAEKLSQFEILVNKVLNNNDGFMFLDLLRKHLWHETPTNPNNTNEFIWVDGKRQVIRDLQTILGKIIKIQNEVKK